MVLPNLLHPVPCDVEPLNRVATIQDDDYREPVQNSERGPLTTVPGQIKWGHDEKLMPTKPGAEQKSDGYVLFRLRDLSAQGLTIKQNDRIVRMGTISTDVYVVMLRYEGHYPDQGGPSLVKAFFKDRTPERDPIPEVGITPLAGRTFSRTVEDSIVVLDGCSLGSEFGRVCDDVIVVVET